MFHHYHSLNSDSCQQSMITIKYEMWTQKILHQNAIFNIGMIVILNLIPIPNHMGFLLCNFHFITLFCLYFVQILIVQASSIPTSLVKGYQELKLYIKCILIQYTGKN